MHKILRNILFARETKCIEVISAISFMLFTFLFILSTVPYASNFIRPVIGDNIFYIGAFMLVSFTQLMVVSFNIEHLRALRCVVNYIAGVFWIWIGVSSIYSSSTITIGDIACFVIGLGVFYAFIVHVLLLRQAYFITKDRS